MIFPLNALQQFVVQGVPNRETVSSSFIVYMSVNINQISQEQVAEMEKTHCNFKKVFNICSFRVGPLSNQLLNTSFNP